MFLYHSWCDKRGAFGLFDYDEKTCSLFLVNPYSGAAPLQSRMVQDISQMFSIANNEVLKDKTTACKRLSALLFERFIQQQKAYVLVFPFPPSVLSE